MLGKTALLLVTGVVVTVLVMGGAAKYVREHFAAVVDPRDDLALPGLVSGSTWTPVRGTTPVREDAVRFSGGQVSTVRCPTTLGTYSLVADGTFSFRAAPGRIRPGCPGALTRKALARATTVTESSHGGHVTIVFHVDDRDLATFRAPAAG